MDCGGCGGVREVVKEAPPLTSNQKGFAKIKPVGQKYDSGEANKVQAPILIPPTLNKPCLWKDARIVAKLNIHTGRPFGDKTYRSYILDNGFIQKDSRIDFFDKQGKVVKSIDIRNAEFTPRILQAKEKDDTTTFRNEGLCFERKNLTIEQIKSAIHPDYRNDKKVVEGYTSSLVNYRTFEEGPSKSFMIEYMIMNYVKGELHNVLTKIIILDSLGNTRGVLDNIKYANNGEVISDDLRYICFGVVDMINTLNEETGGGPTGLMLYDFNERKYLIHKMFPSVENTDIYPNSPIKQGKYIEIDYSLQGCESVKSYSIDLEKKAIYTPNFNSCEEKVAVDFKWYYRACENGTLHQISNPYLKKLTFSQFNSLIFK
jgi:hypothetical protein